MERESTVAMGKVFANIPAKILLSLRKAESCYWKISSVAGGKKWKSKHSGAGTFAVRYRDDKNPGKSE